MCDVALKFSIVGSGPPGVNQLATTAHAEKTLSCEFAVDLVVADGIVQVELDDVGTAGVYVSRVSFADTPELTCDLGEGWLVKLRVEQFIADGLDPFMVNFPFTIVGHDAGTLIGSTSAPHNILASAVINVTESPNEVFLPPGEEPLTKIPGVFPTAAITVTAEEQQISLVFADDATLLFEQTTKSGVTFTLTGLNGTLWLKE